MKKIPTLFSRTDFVFPWPPIKGNRDGLLL